MELTDEFVTGDHLTALMITHHMEDALKYGNRLIVMKDGQIIKDLTKEEKVNWISQTTTLCLSRSRLTLN